MARRSSRPLITSEDFATLAPAWQALHERVPGATPFMHPAWHRAWLGVERGPFDPVFLSFLRDDELIGVMALALEGPLATTLGDPGVCDYGGPLVLPGEEHAVAAGLLEWLREDLTPLFTGWGIVGGSAFDVALEQAAADGGWSFAREAEALCPAVDLSGDWEAYLAGLSKHDRHELRRKMRRFEGAGAVAYHVVREPGAVSETLPVLFALMRMSHPGKGDFLTPEREALFHAVAVELAGAGLTRLGVVHLDERPVAATLAFACGGAEYLWNSGYDPTVADLAPGLVSKAYAIRAAIAEGCTRYDFLRGAEEYKFRLGGRGRELVRVRLESAV